MENLILEILLTVLLSKSGDLLKNIYLDITLPDLNKPSNAFLVWIYK